MPVTGSYAAFDATFGGVAVLIGYYTASIAGSGGLRRPEAQVAYAFSKKMIHFTHRIFPVIPSERIVVDKGAYGSGSYGI